jgi:hypothetical protein
MPFLRAIQKIIDELWEFLPLSLRQIFYQLLNDPPLIHASKPDSRFRNDKRSYWALCDLATRARHEGYIDYEVIDDATRPMTVWPVHRDLSTYYRQQVNDLLSDYWRDLLQSQPNHIELVIEKNTLESIVRPIAMNYTIPYQIGRGQCSTPRLYNIAQRYKASGKEECVILAMNDLDPDGDAIAHSIGQRLRDNFDIPKVKVIKTALKMEQIRELNLPESFERAKDKSKSYERYVEDYNTDFVWELEAVAPKVLQRLLTEHIDAVIDTRAFKAELKAEKQDAVHLARVREIMLRTLREEIDQ